VTKRVRYSVDFKARVALDAIRDNQGSQFTGSAWITVLSEAGVCISMDGRGRSLGNIFIKGLWRSLKQQAVYLEELTDGFKAQRVIRDWMTFYNTDRPIPPLNGERQGKHTGPVEIRNWRHET
jgi:transposase InsO family protein